MSQLKVCIIGSGNLAFHLSKALESSGVNILHVYSRSLKNAEKITYLLYNAAPTDSLDFSGSTAKVFILCISDNAISEISRKLILPASSLLVHCSGSTSINLLENVNGETGVFYPLQTFSAERKMSFVNIPVCIEASSEYAESVLEKMALKLKSLPYFMNSEQRLTLHLSAVFACNFSNHLFSISKSLLSENGLPFHLLHQLIAETVQKAIEKGPENVQTGPAARNDTNTLNKHEELLSGFPEMLQIYKLLTKGIINRDKIF